MNRPLQIALGALALPAVVAALAVGAFLHGLDVNGGFLRAPLERALTAAFGVPTRIEGTLKLHTGLAAVISAEALVLADPLDPAAGALARGIAPRARIDLLALLRSNVVLEEVVGERLELALRRQAGGRTNWQPLFPSSDGPSTVSFGGIERLRVGAVVGTYVREGTAPVPFAVESFDGAIPKDDSLRASGTVQIAGQKIGVELRTAPLGGLGSAEGVPLHVRVQGSGWQATVDGTLLNGGTRLDAKVDAAAADAAGLLAALGIAVKDAGPLALRGHLAATPVQVLVQDIEASLGPDKVSGSVTYAWGGAVPAVELDLAAERLDAAPFLGGPPRSSGTQAVEQWVATLDRLATATSATVKLAVDEVGGLAVSATKVRLDLRSGERRVAAKASAVIAATAVEATLDYDAREPQHRLAARIDSGATSTAALPGDLRPGGMTAAAGSIRGQLSGAGADPAALVASLQGSLDARGVDWTVGRARQRPTRGRFDVVRITLQGTKASSAEVSGTVDGAACGLRITGGAPALLFAGEPWPVRFSATCPNERVNASGRITVGQRHLSADLSFDLAGERGGPVARAVGLPPALPFPLAARGTLALDGTQARLRLAALRLGGTQGSGEIDHPLGLAGTTRLRLALTTLDLDELSAAPSPAGRPADPLERRLIPSDLNLPDADYDLAAERIEYGEARLRNFKLVGSVRGRSFRPAPFRIDWNGMALSGRAGLDFSGARPHLQIDATAQDANLRAVLEALGVDGVRMRAGKLTVSLHAHGEVLRELLASATLDASIAQGQVDLQRPLLPGASGRGSLDAALRAGPGQPSRLTARGQVDGRAIDLALDGPAVEALARDSAALPLSLRSTVDDVRLDADGRFGRDGSVEARVHLAGGRLDQLGHLLGLPLPRVSPYEADAQVTISRRDVDVAGLQASFGSSRVDGRLRVEQRDGGRAAHTVTLHAPVLNLEDIGAGQWIEDRDPAARASLESTAGTAQAALEALLDALPRADVEASVELDALLGGGQRFTSGRIEATVKAGALRARLIDVEAQDGMANAELGIDAGVSPPRFSLRADARDVEYGPLVRAMSPELRMNGQMDFIVDLSADGAPAQLLQALRGTADFAVYPREMSAGALGPWGAGLLPAILRAVERDSQATVQCSVAGFAVADGVARSDGFFVETTRVRIIGDLEVRLGSGELAGWIDPQSNTPQLFAIAPRMQIGGLIGSPSLSVAPENLVLAPLRFASPLTLFSRDWLGRGSRRAGGSAGCREAFDRVLEAHHGQAVPR
jgi:hypothetical protein